MAVGANTYGTVARVQSRVGDLVEIREFTLGTVPTRTEVEEILDDVASEMNSNLAARGFAVPIASGTDPDEHSWARTVNSDEAAVRILAQWFPNEAFDPDNPDVFTGRARGMHGNFRRFMKFVDDGVLNAERTTTVLPKAFSGSQENSAGETKKPLFTRELHDYPGTRSLTES